MVGYLYGDVTPGDVFIVGQHTWLVVSCMHGPVHAVSIRAIRQQGLKGTLELTRFVEDIAAPILCTYMLGEGGELCLSAKDDLANTRDHRSPY